MTFVLGQLTWFGAVAEELDHMFHSSWPLTINGRLGKYRSARNPASL